MEITLIGAGGQGDEARLWFLDRYAEAYPFVTVGEVDPALCPGFVSSYYEGKLSDNSVLVRGPKGSRAIPAEDFYTIGTSPATGRRIETGFDGEGLINGAIDYVALGHTPLFYRLCANGEASLSESFLEAIKKNNLEIRDLNPLTVEEIPSEAAGLLIAGPAQDYPQETVDKICSYLEGGGRALLLTNFSLDPMPGLEAILSDYGLTRLEGVLLEGDGSCFVSFPYCILPSLTYLDFTAQSYGRYLLVPMAQAILEKDSHRSSLSYTPFLMTSSQSYNKADVQNMTTSEKEEGDQEGPFCIGTLVTEDIDGDQRADTQLICISSAYFLDADYNETVSGANAALFGEILRYLGEGESQMAAVPAKTLLPQSLVLSDEEANLWTVLVVFVLPLAVLLAGVVVWLKRRSR